MPTTFRAVAEVRCPDGAAAIDLGGWVSYAPGRALDWLRTRAEHMAQQLGAPYDAAMREWLADEDEYRWALRGLASGIPVRCTTVDSEGYTYTLVARPETSTLTTPRPRTPYGQEAAWLAA
ncbi:hypothetical protein ACWC2K_04975 [Streptomyces chattanoogensis]|uniref:hypothetical protein n=1 Tax=Streptomyces chattanoogensis TaxID=66876 RepID=UPI0036822C30